MSLPVPGQVPQPCTLSGHPPASHLVMAVALGTEPYSVDTQLTQALLTQADPHQPQISPGIDLTMGKSCCCSGLCFAACGMTGAGSAAVPGLQGTRRFTGHETASERELPGSATY